ncbi:MAG TPA: flagellar FliJ family protein [Caulobacteraceae bacterium]|jgi:flagellar FliJ protein|nr:flagellar FliJ family protein [Caulobacteraceae bacterium]
MRWADQLIKLSNFEVEVLQKRLAEVVERRCAAEIRLAVLIAEGEAEAAKAREDALAGWYHAGFLEGLKQRKVRAQADIDSAAHEEAGARDALAEAFETLKKYEQVAESARTAAGREERRRETVALDEIGLRRAAGGR